MQNNLNFDVDAIQPTYDPRNHVGQYVLLELGGSEYFDRDGNQIKPFDHQIPEVIS